MASAGHSDRASLDEKNPGETEVVKVAPSATDDDFTRDSELSPPMKLTSEQERKLYRKIDFWLMPILTLMYTVNFLDRGNIGNAKLQGLTSQLHLTGNKYNIALTMYFIPYCVIECPANLVIKKFRPSRWLPGIVIVWGIIVTLMGLDKTYADLVVTRVALGCVEAGFFPGAAFFLSVWYPRHMLQLRIGIFYGGATIAGAFSGLLAYGISFMSGTEGRLGWSWIFILEGILTVVVGFIAFFVLVDFPDTAHFLTPEERAYIIWRKKYDNSSVGEAEAFAFRHVKSAFLDWQLWPHVLVYMSIVAPLYGISFFLPSIINGFGFNAAISQLLTVPPYVCATTILVIFAVWSDHIKKRSPFILAGLAMCAIGFGINISDAPIGVKYFGTFFCVSGSYAAFPGVITWLGNNYAGQYKRAAGIALHIGFGNLGGAIASNIYRSQDAPRYRLGHGLELMFVGIGFITLPLIVVLYRRINAKRDRIEQEMEAQGRRLSAEEIRELGDKAPEFRYTL